MEHFEIVQEENLQICYPFGPLMSDKAADEFIKVVDDAGNTEHKNLIINFSKATILGSLAIGSLVRAQAHFHKIDGQIAFCCFPEEVKKVLEMTRVLSIINAYDTLEEARKAF